jgi:formylglycine-generating enzyme required for sulfatase activity
VPEYWSDGNPPPGTDDHPVVGVDWWDARAYAGWLGARLPTELEWEKAARWDERANRARRYPWGDPWNRSLSRTACEIAGKDLNGLTWPRWRESFPYSPHRPPTRPVGTYSAGASPFGILDLHGNVWEWCLDEYRPRRPGRSVALLEASTAVAAESPQVETTEGVEGSSDPSRLAKVLRTVRGGSWIDTGAVRAATRARRPQDARGGVLGFRCVATAEVDDASARTATPTTGSGG